MAWGEIRRKWAQSSSNTELEKSKTPKVGVGNLKKPEHGHQSTWGRKLKKEGCEKEKKGRQPHPKKTEKKI